MKISEHGLVLVTVQELLGLSITHFYSEVDTQCAASVHVQQCGSVTSMSGFTEWVSEGLAPVSIAWDWLVSAHPHKVRWHRINLPRTNIQLLNPRGIPLRWDENLDVLATWVDAQCWTKSVAQEVSYKTSHQGAVNAP